MYRRLQRVSGVHVGLISLFIRVLRGFFFTAENVFARWLHGVEHVLWTRLWVFG